MKKGFSTPLILILLLILGIAVGAGLLMLLGRNGTQTSSQPQESVTLSEGEEPASRNVPRVFSSNSTPQEFSERYLDYTPESFDKLANNKRIYFFAASWCPTCQAANSAFLSKLAEIPDNVSVFITNYDEEIELKAKYNITYQHTFVQVDKNGNEITKWNGGDTAELLANIK